MDARHRQDRLRGASLATFLAVLVGAGLLGVPTLLVLLGGVAVAAVAIAVLHVLERGQTARRRPPRSRPVRGPGRGLEYR